LIVSKRRLTCDLVDSLIFDRLGSSRKVIRRESHFGSSSVRPNIDPNKTRPNRQKEYFNGADSYAVYQGSVMGNDLVESGQHQGTSSSDTPSTLQCADDSGHVTSGLLGCYGAGQKGRPVVTGLTKDDFILTGDKKPQRIFSFEAPETHSMDENAGDDNPEGKAPVPFEAVPL
jgi:hypothetical protein